MIANLVDLIAQNDISFARSKALISCVGHDVVVVMAVLGCFMGCIKQSNCLLSS